MGETYRADGAEQRRSVDRIAEAEAQEAQDRLTLAERRLEKVAANYASLAEGQDVLSSVLIGSVAPTGEITVGLVAKVEAIGERQAAMDLTQQHQSLVLEAHGKTLKAIEDCAKVGVDWLRRISVWVVRGVLGIIGIGALHLLGMWWDHIIAAMMKFWAVSMLVAAAAQKGNLP